MHPLEGWAKEGGPPSFSRRSFLRQSAGAAPLRGGVGSFPEARSGSSGPSNPATGQALPLPPADNPLTWPLYPGNKPAKNGLAPEQNATLKIYNRAAYINPQSIKNFGKKYNKIELGTFSTMDEVLAKPHARESRGNDTKIPQ